MHRTARTAGEPANHCSGAAPNEQHPQQSWGPERSAWGSCPNCSRLIPSQVTDCSHCGAIFGLTAAWQVRELPGRVPTPIESAALAAADQRRAERADAMEARWRSRTKLAIAASLGQQLLDTADRLELAKTDKVAESDAGLSWVLLVAVVLVIPAGVIGGGVAVLIGGGMALLLLFALTEREEGFQRTVVMEVANAALTVDVCWPYLGKAHRRNVSAKDLRLSLDQRETGCEGSIDTNWRVALVLPHDADDPGDAHITLAVYGSDGSAAAQALCRRLVSHLGLVRHALLQSGNK